VAAHQMKSPGGVFLGYLHPNEITASFHLSLMDLVLLDQKNPKELGRLVNWAGVRAVGSELPEARNTVVRAMLESDAEWLFFVDSDMGFDMWTLESMLSVCTENGVRLLGGLCFTYKEAGYDGMWGLRSFPLPTIYEYGLDPNTGVEDFRSRAHYPVNSLMRVAATGGALLLIHRSVLEQVRDKYGEVWFNRLPRPDATLYGEDISFFVRTGSLEIEAYVHTGIGTNHKKSIWVSELDFWESFNAPPATETVDVIVPTVKARSGNIPELAASLKASTGLARLVLVLDDEDHRDELHEMGVTGFAWIYQPGSFARKINTAYRESAELNPRPWFQVVGDDCRFHPGWLDHSQMVAKFYGGKVIGSNDLANPRVMRGEHATHWMIARDYIDEQGASWDGPGVVAHEGYRHWFVDDEIVTVARQRGVFQSALAARIEHLHPITGKVASDEVYEKNDKYAAQDRDLFEKRVKANA
jgi:hypothetical protein